MLCKNRFILLSNSKNKYSSYIGSAMQGAMYELLDEEYVEVLHESKLHPYSQYVCREGENLVWTICTLNKNAYKEILEKVNQISEIELKSKNDKMTLKQNEAETIEYENLIKEYYFGRNERRITIEFLTTTSFKQRGNYIIYPDIRLIFQSLMKKYDVSSIFENVPK